MREAGTAMENEQGQLATQKRTGPFSSLCSTSIPSFPFADVDAPPDGGLGVNVFLRDGERLPHVAHQRARNRAARPTLALTDCGRPRGEPFDSPDVARLYGPAQVR